MLRLLESAHRRAAVIPFSLSCSSSGVTFNYGKSLFTSAVRDSAGNYTLTLKTPFNRTFTPVVTAVLDSTGGATALPSVTNTSVFTLATKDSTGSALEPCGVDGFLVGHYTAEVDKYSGKLFPVHVAMLSGRIIFGKVASNGSVSIGAGDITASKTSTGTYSISFRREFAQSPILIPVTPEDRSGNACIKTKTASSAVVQTYDLSANALADSNFSFILLGSQGVGETTKLKELLTTQRNCRIASIAGTLSSSTFTIGGTTTGKDFTSESASSGSANINITDAFARESVVVGSGKTQPLLASASSSSQISLVGLDYDGVVTDTDFYAVVIGSDDSTEYFSAN